LANMPIIRCSTDRYSSPMLLAAFSADFSTLSASGDRYTCVAAVPPTLGRPDMAVSSSARSPLQSTPILPSSDGMSPPS
jgi:hypothetical protein